MIIVSDRVGGVRIGAVVVAFAVVATGCAATPKKRAGTVAVYAAFYPLAFLAERIGGDAVTVFDLTPAGAEPHDVELKPSQVRDLRTGDLTVYLKGFNASVDRAADQGNALDLTSVAPFQNGDPHVWLDPVLMKAMAQALAARLLPLVSHDDAIGRHLAELDAELDSLDVAYRTTVATCARRDIVTSHEAFGYLARRYGLTQVGIAGLNPDEEPTAKRLADVARLVRDKHVTTVFFERLVSPKLAQTVARETGARTAVLDPIEGGTDYLSAMRANLAALKTALGCT